MSFCFNEFIVHHLKREDRVDNPQGLRKVRRLLLTPRPRVGSWNLLCWLSCYPVRVGCPTRHWFHDLFGEGVRMGSILGSSPKDRMSGRTDPFDVERLRRIADTTDRHNTDLCRIVQRPKDKSYVRIFPLITQFDKK